MRIGFDVHGVVQDYPAHFMPVMELLHSLGHEIVIISGPPEDFVRQELGELGYLEGIHFDTVLSIVDYLKPRVPMWKDHKGRWWADDTHWWSSKGKLCKLYGIEVLIDDSIEYSKHFENGCKFILMRDLELDKIFCEILNAKAKHEENKE